MPLEKKNGYIIILASILGQMEEACNLKQEKKKEGRKLEMKRKCTN